MRSSAGSRLLKMGVVVVALSGCMSAEYPDEGDELTGTSTTSPNAGGIDSGIFGSGGTSLSPTATVDAATGAPAPMGTDPSPSPRDAGTSVTPTMDASAAKPDASTAKPDASASTPDATVSEPDAQMPSGNLPASCSVAASTDSSSARQYPGKYGCALWIANGSNKVVKAFMVATRMISGRSLLSTYRTASSGVTVDVVAQATMSAARQHMFTWDLRDSSGKAVAPGKYTFNVETYSGNGSSLVSIPFDLTAEVSATGTPVRDIKSASINCK